MNEIGRVCVKTAGRDASKKCVIVEIIDNNYVIIDGETRRKKCNVAHLEPLKSLVDIKAGAEHSVIAKALGIEARENKSRKTAERPKKAHKQNDKKSKK